MKAAFDSCQQTRDRCAAPTVAMFTHEHLLLDRVGGARLRRRLGKHRRSSVEPGRQLHARHRVEPPGEHHMPGWVRGRMADRTIKIRQGSSSPSPICCGVTTRSPSAGRWSCRSRFARGSSAFSHLPRRKCLRRQTVKGKIENFGPVLDQLTAVPCVRPAVRVRSGARSCRSTAVRDRTCGGR